VSAFYNQKKSLLFPRTNSHGISVNTFYHCSKAIARQDTAGWRTVCNANHKRKGTCRIGFPWPDGVHSEDAKEKQDKDGWKYNCYLNPKVEKYWGPKLREKLVERGILEPQTS
jgi:hypothetical protein